MKKSTALFLCLFSMIHLSAADYYWVGGSGDWNDWANHWATTSGGAAGGHIVVPSPFDNVFFDVNSGFTIGNNTVTVNVPIIFCRSMDWTGATNTPNFISTQGITSTWNIYGSIKLIPNMTFSYDGTMHFLATNQYHTITSAAHHFDGILRFDGLGSNWTIQDSISVNKIQLIEGDFFSNTHPIRVDIFEAVTLSSTNDSLILTNSNIHLYNDGSEFRIFADNSSANPGFQSVLRTNLDNVNFYYNYNLQLTKSRHLYLRLIDNANINTVYFYQPNGVLTPQIGLAKDSLLANHKINIQAVHFYNASHLEQTDFGHSTSELIQINSVITYNQANYIHSDYISDCNCQYVLLEKNDSKVVTGDYGTVHFKQSGTIENGFFDDVIMEGYGTINANEPLNKPDYLGTIVGKAHLFQDGQILKKKLDHPLQFDTLKVTEEHLYYFLDTILFTQNGWLDAVGTCHKPIVFKGAAYDKQFIIDAACDTIRCEYTVLEGSRATGVADFLALSGQDKEGNSNWNFFPPTPRSLYWIGGEGNWDNTQHWSLSSGGMGGECKPTLYDDVFFDNNSGFNNSDTVHVNIPNAFCKSMDWTGVNNLPVFNIPTSNDLYIHGSLTFVPTMKLKHNGTIWFSATTGGNTITTANLHFENEIKMQGKGGDWTLLDSMSVHFLRLTEGDFYSNSNSIRLGYFYADASPTTIDTLDLYHSNIYPYLAGSEFKIYANMNSIKNRLRTNLNATNFYFVNAASSSRRLNLRLADTAYIGEVIYNGNGAGTIDYLNGNGEVYINYVEMNFAGYIRHSETPTTTDLIHIDTLLVFSGLTKVESCDCNYTEIDGDGNVNSGLYNKVIIHQEGKIFNGYFNFVCIDEEAELFTNTPITSTNVRQDDFEGTFIGYANLKDDGHFQQKVLNYPLQFDTLKLTASKLYEFRDTINFTQNGWLDAVGFCDKYITMKSEDATIPFFINTLCDTIYVNYMILENSTGTGTADFIGDNTIDNGGLTNWIINPPQARTLYWVGGNGDWSNPQHWSLTSGGIGGECMPTLEDDVFLDANSGFTPNDSVIIDIELSYCKNMDWTGAANNPIFTTYRSDATFFVNGSLKCITNMNFAYHNDMEFVSDTNGNTITTSNQYFVCGITFNGQGSWTLLDSMTALNIDLDEGDFYTNQQSLSVSRFTAKPANGSSSLDSLNFANSNIYVYTAGGRIDIFGDTTFNYKNKLHTNFDNTNFYYTSTAPAFGRQLSLVLSDSAFINEIIFSGTNQTSTIDVIGLNSFVEINQVEMYRAAFIGFTNNTPTTTDLFRIDSIKVYNTAFATGFNGNINYCDCDDVFIAGKGSVNTGRYNTVLVQGESHLNDGKFGVAKLESDATVVTGGILPTNALFPETTFGTLLLDENATIIGEAGNGKPLLVDTIRLVPGREYRWKNVMTITANGWLDAIGTGSLPIIMRSTQAGVQGTIKSLTDSICINYIFMSDLDTAGTAVFHAGKISTDIVNNDGWVFEDCCSSFGLSELFPTHDTTICAGDSISLVVYDALCTGCTFLWQDNDTNEIRILSPTTTTTYIVTAFRPEGCSSTDTFRINIIQPPIINLQNDTTISDTSQSLVLYHSPTGGMWSGTGVNNTGLFNPMSVGQGVYPLTYTISNAFCDATDSVTITVTLDGCQFDTLHLTNYNNYDVSCNGGNDGSAQIMALKGTAPFTYVWSNGNMDSIATNLTAGIYTITATDANGCTNILSITITEPPLLTASAIATTPISFPGLNDGVAIVNPSGGTPTYTYLWSNNETTATITNLFAGTYTVTVTDANGCTTVASITLSDPTIYIAQPQILSNYNNYNISCFGTTDGSATVMVANGTTPYSYLWSNNETTATAINLPSGWSYITITDANNQILIDSVHLTEPMSLVASANIVNPISCFGITDGSLSANAVGGVPNYTYLWNNNSISTTLNNLNQGTYYVTITDANNCIDSAAVTLTEPTLLTVSITQDSIYNGFGVRCFNGNDGHVTAFASGGTVNYTYAWNNTQTLAAANNLSAGQHIVTVTDANNCTTSDTIILNQPTAITTITTVTTDYNGFNIRCFGGNDASVNTMTSGGVPMYSYEWNNMQTLAFANNLSAGFAIVTITDANNCVLIDSVNVTQPTALNIGTLVTSNYNGADISCFGANDGSVSVTLSGGVFSYNFQWNTNQTDSNLMNLTAGTYFVTATDANNCVINDSIILTEPLVLANTLTTSSTSCDGSQDITANTTGGTGNYIYSWNNGHANNINTNLFGGTYSVTISDANSCTLSDSITITTLDTLFLNLGNDTILCLGESLILDATQAAITNYTWQDNTTQPTFIVTENGNYFVEITNINGCTTTDSILVTYAVIELLQSLPIDTTICKNTTFDIDATTIDAISYLWQDGTTMPTYTAFEEGIYTVTVTNIYNCTADFSTTISVQLPPEIALQLPTDTIMCNNNPITLNASAIYATDYYWEGESAFYQQNSQIDSIFLVTYPGIYSVEISNYCGGLTQFVEVTEEDCGCYPYVPNAFTPNNDGNNDAFQVFANCPLENFHLEIYDRFGGRVFISDDINDKWDGTIQGQQANIGVYVWVLQFSALNEKGEMEARQKSGDVTVVR